jgi:RNA polymerase sigma factor (sigma-70 family)
VANVAAQGLNDFVRRVAGDYPATDADLLRSLALDRNQTAFRILLHRHGRAVWAACRQVLGESADADDAFQATFILFWQSAGRIRRAAAVGAWLYGTAHRVACQARAAAIRRRRHEHHAAAATLVRASSPDQTWREACSVLHAELDRLPDRYRLPLVLCYLNGLSRDEAAARLGWSAGSVKGRLERGRERLRKRLTRRGIDLSAGLLAAVVGGTNMAVSAELVQGTIHAAAGIASPAVTALVRGAGLGTRAKVIVLAAMLGLTAVGVGGGAIILGGAVPADPPKNPDPPVTTPIQRAPAVPTTAYHARVSTEAGQPVAGATVLAVGDVGKGERLSTTTDADGRFAFDRLPFGKTAFPSVQLIVVRPGFAPTEQLIVTSKPGPASLTLRAAAAFGGSVKDAAGRPITGAEVQVGTVHRSKGITSSGSSWGFRPESAVRGTPAEQFFFTKTDAAGGFQFAAVAPGDELIFRVFAKGFGELTERPTLTAGHVARDGSARADLVLMPEAVIHGQVTSEVPGNSLDSVEVRLEGNNELHGFHRTLKPGADGHFTADRLPAGQLSVFLNLPPNAAATAAGDKVLTEAGKTNEVSLRIVAGVEVVGRVVIRDTSEPVPGAFMATTGLVNPSGFHFAGHPTDADGRFVLRLPPGRGAVMVWGAPDGYRQSDGRRQEVVVPADVARLELPKPFELLRPIGGTTAAPRLVPPVGSPAGKPAPGGPPLPVPAERQAAAVVRQHGGWYELDGEKHVVEINMVALQDADGRHENGVTDTDGALRVAGKFPHLKRVLLTRGQATDDGFAALAGLADLEELFVWDAAKVSDAGVRHLAGLSKLRAVHISNGKIGDDALAIFARIPSLKSLSLQGNNFTDAGLKHVSNMTRLKSLWVGMSTGLITDVGVPHLAHLSQLEELDLQHAALTDQGLLQLAELPKLQALYLTGPVFSRDAIEKVRTEHPKLRLDISSPAKKP